MERGNKIRRLPDSGKAIVVSDLHGNLDDFETILANSQVFSRMAAGEELYLVITGDICDVERHKLLAPGLPTEGDIRILDRLIEMRRQLGTRDGIIYLEGNHDFHILRICEEMRREGCACVGKYAQQYQQKYGDFLFQNNLAPYDMIYRAEAKYLDFIGSGPLLVLCDNGIVITHAGPTRCRTVDSQLLDCIAGLHRKDHFFLPAEELYNSYYLQMLCNRYCLKDYTITDLKNFLQSCQGSILITGHTPLSYFRNSQQFLPECRYHQGLIVIGEMQVVFATSFGAYPGEKKYLELDLAVKYRSPLEWKAGKEILSLYPNGGVIP